MKKQQQKPKPDQVRATLRLDREIWVAARKRRSTKASTSAVTSKTPCARTWGASHKKAKSRDGILFSTRLPRQAHRR